MFCRPLPGSGDGPARGDQISTPLKDLRAGLRHADSAQERWTGIPLRNVQEGPAQWPWDRRSTAPRGVRR